MSTDTPKRPEPKKSSPQIILGIPKFSADMLTRISQTLAREHSRTPITFNVADNAFGGLRLVEHWLGATDLDAVKESQVTGWMSAVLGDHSAVFRGLPQSSAHLPAPQSFLGLVSMLKPAVQSKVMSAVTAALSPLSAGELKHDPYRGAYQDLTGIARESTMREQVAVIVKELMSLSAGDLYSKLLMATPAAAPAAAQPGATKISPDMVLKAMNRCNKALAPQALIALDQLCNGLLYQEGPSEIGSKTFFSELRLKLAMCSKQLTAA